MVTIYKILYKKNVYGFVEYKCPQCNKKHEISAREVKEGILNPLLAECSCGFRDAIKFEKWE